MKTRDIDPMRTGSRGLLLDCSSAHLLICLLICSLAHLHGESFHNFEPMPGPDLQQAEATDDPDLLTEEEPELADPPAVVPIPDEWQADKHGKLSVTTERYKSIGHSLRWKWEKAGAALTFRSPEAFKGLRAAGRRGASCFGMWVYNEKPVPAKMRGELLRGEEVVARFWFWMDYKGWRPLGARYADTGWKQGQPVDALRIYATDGQDSGRLYLDHVKLNFLGRGPGRSHQTPWVGQEGGLDAPASVLLTERDITQNRPWLPAGKAPEEITEQERADMAKLAERVLPTARQLPANARLPGTNGDSEAAESLEDSDPVKALRARLEAWGIRRRNGILTGRPIDNGSFLKPADAVSLGAYVDLCKAARSAFHRAKKPEDASRLAGVYVDLVQHLLDQGWVEGSPMGGAGGAYTVRYWPPAFYDMRAVLAEAGLRRDLALCMFAHFAGGSAALAQNPGASMDTLQGFSRSLLPCALMFPDEAERLQRLRVVQRFFSLVFLNHRTLGPDGCAYHHGMFHYAYASYSMPLPINAVSAMQDTVFRISPEAHRRLKTYVYAMAFAANKYQMPANLNGRAGTPMKCNMAGLAAKLAQLGTPDGSEEIDPEMAGLHLTLTTKPGEEPAATWRKQGIRPLSLSGHWTMNGSAAALHRRDRWLVSMVGMIRFWRGLEIYGWTQSNNYSRYARHGSILIHSTGDPVTAKDSGYTYDGWNWCHWPGTTSLVRPSRELFVGYGFGGNRTSFAGGTRLGKNGVWGIDFQGADVHFRKSAFCFDNRITVITTNIRSKQDRPAVTTLFQAALDPAKEALHVNGESVNDFPWTHQFPAGQPHWILDHKRIGYYVHPSRNPIQVRRQNQQWTYMISRYLKDPKDNPIEDYRYRRYRHKDMAENEKYFTPSTGDFSLAWFDHGVEPTDAACTYTILVETTPEAMEKLAADLASAETAPYTIRQQDEKAHILRDRASATTSYVLFEAHDKFATEGPLLANSRPCFVMVQESEDKLHLSVASTDIALKDPIILRLHGQWQLPETDAAPTEAKTAHEEDVTVLELPYEYYMPMAVALRKGTSK